MGCHLYASGQACSAAFHLQMMEQLYCCDLVTRPTLVRAGCTTSRWGWTLGRRGYWMYFPTPCNKQNNYFWNARMASIKAVPLASIQCLEWKTKQNRV